MLNDMQRTFVRAIGLTIDDAFLRLGLARVKLRRDFAAHGFLHKIIIQIGLMHPDFDLIFPRTTVTPLPTRLGSRRHSREFQEFKQNRYYFNQSICGAVQVYNILPEYVVAAGAVNDFQRLLTKDAKIACQVGQRNFMKCKIIGIILNAR